MQEAMVFGARGLSVLKGEFDLGFGLFVYLV